MFHKRSTRDFSYWLLEFLAEFFTGCLPDNLPGFLQRFSRDIFRHFPGISSGVTVGISAGVFSRIFTADIADISTTFSYGISPIASLWISLQSFSWQCFSSCSEFLVISPDVLLRVADGFFFPEIVSGLLPKAYPGFHKNRCFTKDLPRVSSGIYLVICFEISLGISSGVAPVMSTADSTGNTSTCHSVMFPRASLDISLTGSPLITSRVSLGISSGIIGGILCNE